MIMITALYFLSLTTQFDSNTKICHSVSIFALSLNPWKEMRRKKMNQRLSRIIRVRVNPQSSRSCFLSLSVFFRDGWLIGSLAMAVSRSLFLSLARSKSSGTSLLRSKMGKSVITRIEPHKRAQTNNDKI